MAAMYLWQTTCDKRKLICEVYTTAKCCNIYDNVHMAKIFGILASEGTIIKKNEIRNYLHLYLYKLKVHVSTFLIFYLGKGKKDAEFRF